jgi:hypothetical protein
MFRIQFGLALPFTGMDAAPSEAMRLVQSTRRFIRGGFTILELLFSCLLIALSVGSIMSMNIRSIDTLRASHQTAAASQILQERVELMRKTPWVQVACSAGLVRLMGQALPSESEIADGAVIERVNISVPQDTEQGPEPGTASFRVMRSNGAASVEMANDFTNQQAIFVEDSVTWHDHSGEHMRTLRTIICSAGLTRSGIFGSQVGRPQG